MSWNEIMQRVLSPVWNDEHQRYVPPHVTSSYGDTNRPKGSTNPHRAVDFDYVGGRDSQFNKNHAALRSPVDGVVTSAGEGDYGTIAIRDANGFSHEILHTHSRHVAVGDRVVADQLIGTMGNTGVKQRRVESGDFHVHYQLKDPAGNVIDPSAYWDQQGPIDPNPASPVHFADYRRHLNTRGAVDSPSAALNPRSDGNTSQPFGTGRQFVPGSAMSSQSLYGTRSFVSPEQAAEHRKNFRQLVRVDPEADPGGYNPNAPATAPNQIPAPGAPSFDDRFGNWTSSPLGNAPIGPNQPVAPVPQPGRPGGILPGQPMPDIPLPPQVFGFPDPSQTPGYEDWSLQRLRPPSWSRK